MSYKYKHKKKSVHLEDPIHTKLSKKAKQKGISIERVVNDILKKELKPKSKKKK